MLNSKDQEENMLIDEKHKHSRMMSYRWLVSNAIFQASCLLAICLTVFLFPLLQYDNRSNLEVSIKVLHIQIDGGDSRGGLDYSITDFGPNKQTCDHVSEVY